MKILITGANGMLAKSVREKLSEGNELICTDVNELDITDETAVLKKVEEIKPEYIINCAAYTAVDKAENTYHCRYHKRLRAENQKTRCRGQHSDQRRIMLFLL